ncbi:MAG: DHH family phosphoesterase [Candidatus Sericytochromatia bacterium]|nr:DHH family phosphoesterase [Candidatus Sericytochromatia bacterium]
MQRADVETVAELLRTEDDFIVCGHYQPDGDTLGASAALGLMLKAMGKKVQTLTPGPLPDPFINFLAETGNVSVGWPQPTPGQWIITCDCGNAGRLVPPGTEVFPIDRLINIDHHHDNSLFGTVNLVLNEASSTAEVVYRLALALNCPITKEIAECLYAGLATDTNGFSLNSTTPFAHRMAADLVAAGVDSEHMHALVYEQLTKGAVRMHGLAMSELREAAGGRIVWAVITREIFDRTGTVEEQSDSILNKLREVAGVDLYCLMRETLGGFVKVSFRSKNDMDVSAIARHFGGGGHIHAAGCVLDLPLAEVEKQVIAVLEAELLAACRVG